MCRIFRMLVVFLLCAFAAADVEPIRNKCPPFAQFYCGCNMIDYAQVKPIKICFQQNQEYPCYPCGIQLQEHVNCNDCPENVCPICSLQAFGMGAKEYSNDPDQIFFRFKPDGSIFYLPKVSQNNDNFPAYESTLRSTSVTSQSPVLQDTVNKNHSQNSDTSNFSSPSKPFEEGSENSNNMGPHIAYPWNQNSNNRIPYPVFSWVPYDPVNSNTFRQPPVLPWVLYEPGSDNSNTVRESPVLSYDYASDHSNNRRPYPVLPQMPYEHGLESSNADRQPPVLPNVPYENGSEKLNAIRQSHILRNEYAPERLNNRRPHPALPQMLHEHRSENADTLRRPPVLPWVPHKHSNLNISNTHSVWPQMRPHESVPLNTDQKNRDARKVGKVDSWNSETLGFHSIHGRNLKGEKLHLNNSYGKRDTKAPYILTSDVDSQDSSRNSDNFSVNGTELNETIKGSKDINGNLDDFLANGTYIDETFEDSEDNSEIYEDYTVSGTDIDEKFDDSEDGSDNSDDHVNKTDMDETFKESGNSSRNLDNSGKDHNETLKDFKDSRAYLKHLTMHERNMDGMLQHSKNKNAISNINQIDLEKNSLYGITPGVNSHFYVTEKESTLYINENDDVNVSSAFKNGKSTPEVKLVKIFLLLHPSKSKMSDKNSRFSSDTGYRAFASFWQLLKHIQRYREMQIQEFMRNFLSGQLLKPSNQNPQLNLERFMMRYNKYILQAINKTAEGITLGNFSLPQFVDILNASLSSLKELNIYDPQCVACSVVYKMMLDSESQNEPMLTEHGNSSFIAIMKKPTIVMFIRNESSFVIHIRTDLLVLSPRMYREFQFNRPAENGVKDDLYPEFAFKVPDDFLFPGEGGSSRNASYPIDLQYVEMKQLRRIIFAILNKMFARQKLNSAVKQEIFDIPTSRSDFKGVRLSAEGNVSRDSIKEENVSNGTYVKRVSDNRFNEVSEETKVANDTKTDTVVATKQDTNQSSTQDEDVSEIFRHLMEKLYKNENPDAAKMAGKISKMFNSFAKLDNGGSPDVSKKNGSRNQSIRKTIASKKDSPAKDIPSKNALRVTTESLKNDDSTSEDAKRTTHKADSKHGSRSSSRIAKASHEGHKLLGNGTNVVPDKTHLKEGKDLKRTGAVHENHQHHEKKGGSLKKLKQKSASKHAVGKEAAETHSAPKEFKQKTALKDEIGNKAIDTLPEHNEDVNKSLNKIPGTPSRSKRNAHADRVNFKQSHDKQDGMLFDFHLEDSDVPRRVKRYLPQNSWCSIKLMRRRGNVDCSVWTFKKQCTMTCHSGSAFMGKKSEKFTCQRKQNEWEPDINKACQSSGGGGANAEQYPSTQADDEVEEEEENEEDDIDEDDEDEDEDY